MKAAVCRLTVFSWGILLLGSMSCAGNRSDGDEAAAGRDTTSTPELSNDGRARDTTAVSLDTALAAEDSSPIPDVSTPADPDTMLTGGWSDTTSLGGANDSSLTGHIRDTEMPAVSD
jgi:hypothetical protein